MHTPLTVINQFRQALGLLLGAGDLPVELVLELGVGGQDDVTAVLLELRVLPDLGAGTPSDAQHAVEDRRVRRRHHAGSERPVDDGRVVAGGRERPYTPGPSVTEKTKSIPSVMNRSAMVPIS